MAAIRLEIFQVETSGGIFEADDFDWGHPNEYGEQCLTFFQDGELLCSMNIDEVHKIAKLYAPHVVREACDGTEKESFHPPLKT